jgi:hypothetical protein
MAVWTQTAGCSVTEVEETRSLGGRTRRVFVTAFASQAVAAAAIASTSLLGLVVSDAYAIGLQVGNGALTGLALGIVYFLAIGRPGFQRWRYWKFLTVAFSAALTAVTIAFTIVRHGDEATTTVVVTAILGVGGACLGIAGIDAVREACLGRPVRISSLTIVPNVCLIIGSLVVLSVDGTGRSAVPAIAWALGCCAVMASAARARSVSPPPTVAADEPHRLHAVGLAVGAIVSTFMPPLFLTAVAHLEPGTATVLLLVTRMGGSAIGLAANSILVTRYSWSRSNVFNPGPFERVVLLSLGCFVAGLALEWQGVTLAAAVAGLAWWLFALIPTPFVNRELNSQRRAGSVLLKSSVDLAFALGSLSLLLAAPSALGFLAVFVISQGLSIAIGASALHHTRLALLAAMLLISGWAALILGAL